jgi:hypothetical protein
MIKARLETGRGGLLDRFFTLRGNAHQQRHHNPQHDDDAEDQRHADESDLKGHQEIFAHRILAMM